MLYFPDSRGELFPTYLGFCFFPTFISIERDAGRLPEALHNFAEANNNNPP